MPGYGLALRVASRRPDQVKLSGTSEFSDLE